MSFKQGKKENVRIGWNSIFFHVAPFLILNSPLIIERVNLITLLNVKRLDIRFSLLVTKRNLIFLSGGISWKEKMLKLKLGHQEIDIYRSRSHTADWNGKNE